MSDMQELVHSCRVLLPSGCHEEMFYVRPSDAEKLVREIERLRVEMGQLATDHLRAQHRAAKENIRLRAIVAD